MMTFSLIDPLFNYLISQKAISLDIFRGLMLYFWFFSEIPLFDGYSCGFLLQLVFFLFMLLFIGIVAEEYQKFIDILFMTFITQTIIIYLERKTKLFMDNRDRREEEIFERTVSRLKKKINLFTADILCDFRACFEEFAEYSKEKEQKYLETIDEQKQVVQGMKKFIELAKNCEQIFMEKGSSHPVDFQKNTEIISSQKVLLQIESKETHQNIIGNGRTQQPIKQGKSFFKQTDFRQNPFLEKMDNEVKEESLEIQDRKFPAKIVRTQKQLDELESKGEKSKDKEDNEKGQSQSKRDKDIKSYRNIQKKRNDHIIKCPLRCTQRFNIYRKLIKPNITALRFVCYYNRLKKFTKSQVKKLSEHDLSEVEEISICEANVINSTLKSLCQLQWHNIISLVLADNQISDITPIKHFYLEKLLQLQISYNPLNYQSAVFLAKSPFLSLVSFFISFDKDNANQAWRIIIEGGMLNYPKLERIVIEKCDQFTQQTKTDISACIKKLEIYQKQQQKSRQQQQQNLEDKISLKQKIETRHSNKLTHKEKSEQFQQNASLPKGYQIKINWFKQEQNLSEVEKNLQKKMWEELSKEMGLKYVYLNPLSQERFKQKLEKAKSEKNTKLLKETADIVKQEHKDSVRKRKIIRKNKKQSIDYQVISDDSKSKQNVD